MYEDIFSGADAGNTGSTQLPAPNDGTYTALRVEKIQLRNGIKPGQTHKTFFKCIFTVISAENGHQAGELVEMFETVKGSAFPHFDQQAVGRVMRLLGAIAGFSESADINTNVKPKDLVLAASDANPFKGCIVSAIVTSKPGAKRYAHVVCSPAKGVDNAPIAPSASGVQPAPVAPPAAFPPAGWTAHPSAPGYFYQGQTVLSEADLRKQVA